MSLEIWFKIYDLKKFEEIPKCWQIIDLLK